MRASTVGEVSFANCHPFVFGEYSFVHNGTIREFDKYRRAWLAELDQDFFEAILGQTDSELLFYLILQEIRRGLDWMGAIRKVFRKIQAAQESHGDEVFSFLNIALTDGKSLVATRYATKSETPLSLHYAVGKTVCSGERVFTEESQHQQIGPAHQSLSRAVIIASEALTDYAPEWEVLPEGKMLLVDDHFKIQIEDI